MSQDPSSAEEIARLRARVQALEAAPHDEEGRNPLAEMTARANAVFEAAVDGILTIDESGCIESANPAACRIFGYDAAEIIGKNVKMLMPPPFSDEHDRYLADYLRTGTKKIIGIGREVVGLRRDGTTFPVELAVGEALAGDRKIFSGIIRDITNRRLVEDDRASLGRILEDSRNEIFVFDDTTLRFRLVNRGARENLGFSLEELRTMTPIDIKPEFNDAAFHALLEPLRSGERDTVELHTIHRRKDGSDYRVDIRLQHSRERHEFVAIVLDLTEREDLEQQLQQSQKMEAIGTLAGGVAHDFNNLLTSIQGSSELILAKAEPGGSVARSADRIGRAVQRGEALTKQLLAFSRKQVTHPVVFALNGAIREVAQLFERLIGEDIWIDWKLDESAGAIHFDPAQFDQVVINLVANARDAMPHGGQLAISTSRVHFTPEQARAIGMKPGDHALLSLRDSGEGIPTDVLPNIFDPFFTTKAPGRGTGLGLSTVLGIVQQHAGAIRVDTKAGKGTEFTLYFPRLEAAKAVPTPTPPIADVPAIAESTTVLVVEDDTLLRELLGEVLDDAGYTFLGAEGPRAALDLVAAHAGTIDAVVTDVVMPEMSGFVLAKQLAKSFPDLAVLYMSGYTDQVLADRGELTPEDAFIRKPFANDALLAAIGDLLGNKPR